MIASLRRRHRLFWNVLPFVLGGVLLVSWVLRRPSPIMDRLPEILGVPSKP
ncbi:MAG: hypothetical protein U1F61_19100 [Opitutaceae bacterium]